ncbi:hypothetical protein [Natrialba taiwanensis]|uniref:Uncharacterized protein n=1 Tax=Natrialba taiwanensis DSM 12281 TaxID=1230458 RepID=M0A4F9_9EURY|nr:hypothetical protein [Natrialba taiwanensis]ELY92233.1 hypothetical protein C484_09601 [Natrialba taiwanensis DSM 12281]
MDIDDSQRRWYDPIVRTLDVVLTRFAAVVLSLVVVSVIRDEYYAIPAELLSATVVFGVGRVLRYGTSGTEETSSAQAFASTALVWCRGVAQCTPVRAYRPHHRSRPGWRHTAPDESDDARVSLSD